MRFALLIAAGVVGVVALACGIFLAATWAPERTVAELQPRWAPPPSQFVDVEGMQVHLRDEGRRDDSSPIVLLHGTGGSLHVWDGWTEALEDDRRVIRFDLAGFGLTGPSPDGRYGTEHDVRLVIAVLDKLGVARCVLGGNSLGGRVAWRTAAAHPERVEKLILVGAGGYASTPQSQPLGFSLARVPGISWLMRHTLPRFLVAQGLRNVFGDPSKVTQEMIDRSAELMQREGNRTAFIERQRQAPARGPSHLIRELTLPTLIIWGGRDRWIPPENAHRFHRDIAGSQLAMFDDLGHSLEEEDPVRTVAPVRQFLGLE
jgi:pimeloyl-ACP methyl ester carboxylesterase